MEFGASLRGCTTEVRKVAIDGHHQPQRKRQVATMGTERCQPSEQYVVCFLFLAHERANICRSWRRDSTVYRRSHATDGRQIIDTGAGIKPMEISKHVGDDNDDRGVDISGSGTHITLRIYDGLFEDLQQLHL
eukprot:8580208-Pyramimonas_sp.AAC.1